MIILKIGDDWHTPCSINGLVIRYLLIVNRNSTSSGPDNE